MSMANLDNRIKGLLMSCGITRDFDKECPKDAVKLVRQAKCYRCPHVRYWKLDRRNDTLQEIIIVDVE
jgi:hypothetical protein